MGAACSGGGVEEHVEGRRRVVREEFCYEGVLEHARVAWAEVVNQSWMRWD